MCQTSRVRAGCACRRTGLKWGPAPYFQRTESCMRAGVPIARRIASNCAELQLDAMQPAEPVFEQRRTRA
ncbi:hypothetical protein DF135_04005 [Burkholderia cepacia]|nr:hypothetical protein DF135_04005 [Burkholderia cepacia]